MSSELAKASTPPSVANLQTEAVASLGPRLSTKFQPAVDGKTIRVVSISTASLLCVSQVLLGSQLTPPTVTIPGRLSKISSLRLPKMQRSAKPLSHRHREMEFLRNHRQFFAKYVDKWVALEGETIVAHGNDPAKVAAAARRAGVEIPFVFRVQPKLAPNEGTLGL